MANYSGTRPDWENLYVQGRCKAIGVPWSDEERAALRELGIPVEYVREGVLTKEDYNKVLKDEAKVEKDTGEKPVERMTADELLVKAADLGVKVTPHAPKDVLVNLVKKAAKPKKHV